MSLLPSQPDSPNRSKFNFKKKNSPPMKENRDVARSSYLPHAARVQFLIWNIAQPQVLRKDMLEDTLAQEQRLRFTFASYHEIRKSGSD